MIRPAHVQVQGSDPSLSHSLAMMVASMSWCFAPRVDFGAMQVQRRLSGSVLVEAEEWQCRHEFQASVLTEFV